MTINSEEAGAADVNSQKRLSAAQEAAYQYFRLRPPGMRSDELITTFMAGYDIAYISFKNDRSKINADESPCDEIRRQHAGINLAYDAADALVEWRQANEEMAHEARIPVQHLIDHALSSNEQLLWHIAGQLMQQRGIKSRFDIGIAQQEQQP